MLGMVFRTLKLDKTISEVLRLLRQVSKEFQTLNALCAKRRAELGYQSRLSFACKKRYVATRLIAMVAVTVNPNLSSKPRLTRLRFA